MSAFHRQNVQNKNKLKQPAVSLQDLGKKQASPSPLSINLNLNSENFDYPFEN